MKVNRSCDRSCDMVEVGGVDNGFGVDERKGDGCVESFLLRTKA